MEALFDLHWTAERVMAAYPQTVAVFVALRTNCVGCQLERFCTLGEVAEHYTLQPGDLLEKLQASVQTLMRSDV